jgi:hypothetical protein
VTPNPVYRECSQCRRVVHRDELVRVDPDNPGNTHSICLKCIEENRVEREPYEFGDQIDTNIDAEFAGRNFKDD